MKCAVCAAKLSSTWEKPLCLGCVSSLVKDQSVMVCHKILSSVKNEIAPTFQFFKSLMDRMQGSPVTLT